VTVLFSALGRHDERFLHALVLRRVPWLDQLMRAVTRLGDASFVIIVAAAAQFSIDDRLRSAAHLAAFALVSSHLLVHVLKRRVTRPRPRLPVGVASLIQAPDHFSFPSGHAAASLSIALPLAGLLPTTIAVLLVSLACLVGISRCYLGVHYPGDVLAGWALALGSLAAGTLI
jgi:undecaprenyl-diphosphatase